MDKELPKAISTQTVVLYNQEGLILHTHQEVTLPGGRTGTDDEVEARAKDLASAAGHNIGALSILRVPAEEYDESSVYRVDVGKKELVREDRSGQ